MVHDNHSIIIAILSSLMLWGFCMVNTQKPYSYRARINSIAGRNMKDERDVKDRYSSVLDQPKARLKVMERETDLSRLFNIINLVMMRIINYNKQASRASWEKEVYVEM